MQRTLHRQPPEPLGCHDPRFGGYAEGVSKPLDLVIRGFNGPDPMVAHGLFNAITATARDIDDRGDRLDLEEFAGRIVAAPARAEPVGAGRTDPGLMSCERT